MARLRRLVPSSRLCALCLLAATPRPPTAARSTPSTTNSSPTRPRSNWPSATRRSRCCAKQHDPPCETTAEQYQPTSVDTVLGNPTVTLTHEDLGDGKLKTSSRRRPPPTSPASPTATTSTSKARSLGDTCVYARAFAKLVEEGKAPAITYAHIAREPNHSGFALQYWFFWYFNQFNDLHEGDWEGMQLTFEAETTGGRRCAKNRAKSSSSSTPAASAPTGTTPRCRRKGRTRSSTRRPARTRPSTTPPSTSRTASTAPASAATTPPSRCANCSRSRCCCRHRVRTRARSSGSATAAAGANGKRASTTARPGR